MNRIILLINNEKHLSLIRDRLAKNYQVLETGLDQSLDFGFDLGIVDEAALQHSWEQVQTKKEAARPIFLPFLLVATRRNADFVTRHLWQTVDEIIWMPVNPLELQTRVENLLRSRRLSLEAQRLTNTDSLTGLHNRRHFFELGEREIQRARRFRRSLAVVMAELDHLQRIFDKHGYEVGNQVLRLIAQRFLDNMRTIDVMGRYAEEKFVILLTDTDMRGAEKVAERLRHEVSEIPFRTGSGSLAPTISLGISSATADMPPLDFLVERADNALCAAKQSGRNCCRMEELRPEGIVFVSPDQP